MESVMDQIKQARMHERAARKPCDQPHKNKDTFTTEIPNEAIINGCQVKMRFDPVGDIKIMTSIQAMLLSAYADAVLVPQTGGGDVE